jgi:integrase
MKCPTIESHGRKHRFVWRCQGRKQYFSHEDYGLVLQAARFILATGTNRITDQDPALRSGEFLELETYDIAREKAEALAAQERTFAAVAERLIVERENEAKIKDDTAKFYRNIVRFDLADWADRDIADFTKQDLVDKRIALSTATFDHRGKPLSDEHGRPGYAPKVVANRIGFAMGVLYYATCHGYTEVNATQGFDHKKNPPRRRTDRFVERDVWDEVAAYAEPDVELLFDVMAETGARIGEARALQVCHVRFGRRPCIDIVQQLDKGNRVVPPKWGSAGQVSITPKLADRLQAHIGTMPRVAWLFTTPTGRPWWYGNLHGTRWQPMIEAARKAGVLAADEILTPHDLRHSHGSWLLNKGVPMMTVSRRLRHKNIQTTINIYGHVDKASNQQVMDALS